jgi:excisionase family DNA binding protein
MEVLTVARKQDKKKARVIAQAQKQRQIEKLQAPPLPEAYSSENILPVVTAPSSASLLLTVADLCALLSISRSTLHRMEKAGEIPGRLKLGGQVRYHRETVEAWLRGLLDNKENIT